MLNRGSGERGRGTKRGTEGGGESRTEGDRGREGEGEVGSEERGGGERGSQRERERRGRKREERGDSLVDASVIHLSLYVAATALREMLTKALYKG